jgi:cyclic beta-1,2-glucan synthetase
MIRTEHHTYEEFFRLLNKSQEYLNQDIIQEELFSIERLEQYAENLATELALSPRSRRVKTLRPILKHSWPILESAYHNLARAMQERKSVSPAAEWFVDNFHLTESQFREIKTSLPDDYYFGLPQLAGGELKQYPRVYALALAFIAHTDSRLDTGVLHRFLSAFQKQSPLQIGELWALVITLRIVLIQNLTLLAERLVNARNQREAANELADKLLAQLVRPEIDNAGIIRMLGREIESADKFNRPFVVQLIQRLRDQDADVSAIFQWLEKKLTSFNSSTRQITHQEMHRQAAAQVTIGNIIGSLRLLTTMDWRDFIESINVIDPILTQDPANAYSDMDFSTRDSYRHAVEGLSKQSKKAEAAVASLVLERAQTAAAGSPASHVGYHLIGRGRADLERQLEYRPFWNERLRRLVERQPTGIYLSLICLFTLIFLTPVLLYLARYEVQLIWLLLFSLVAIVPASEIALSLLNHFITHAMRPAPLPRMDPEKGIPEDAATMVVIPTLFARPENAQEMIKRLEIHALANPDPNLSFALLGDFTDAPTEQLPGDAIILAAAQQGIARLNDRYCPDTEPRFHLFHRKRIWNQSEGAFIGWERKRGKLLEFNRLLRGARDTSYILSTAGSELCSQIKYVITLDSDTQLPREAALKLVSTIMHPLNRPQIDHKRQQVTAGYGILQPRISITVPSAEASNFSRISSGNTGIDPYTTAVSDVYQDLFKEGSFTGKGLYVVDAFEAAMEKRVPENAVLSHDLFEGSYARSALVSDVELFDDYPEDYETFSKRGHRWTRGDWQIAPWLLPWVKNEEGQRVSNDLSMISRWKIFDNLRRSLSPIAALSWLLLAWTVLPGSPFMWTLFIVLMFLFPVYATFVTGDWMNRGGVTWSGYFTGSWKNFRIKLWQIFITIAFLAKQAWNHADAIIRALYRMNISRKKMLEWTSFAQLAGQKKSSARWREIIDPGPLLALAIGCLVLILRPEALVVASPFLLMWLANPWIKGWLAQKPKPELRPINTSELQEYRRYARATWHFFEDFLTAEDNWLAPDNYQEDPKPVLAHRTSPTNIGLQLLAQASAYDLGYLAKDDLITQTELTFHSLEQMDKLHGHFFNWYDTLTLQPLHPRYVSTVDSGNLAAHLIMYKQFLMELAKTERPLINLKTGLLDTLAFLQEVLLQTHVLPAATGTVTIKQLQQIVDDLIRKFSGLSTLGVDEFHQALLTAETKLIDAFDILEALTHDAQANSAPLGQGRSWIGATLKLVRGLIKDTAGAVDYSHRLQSLARACDQMVQAMDFGFLFDLKKKLFVIGYNVQDHRMDNSFYDLLASESRLASFMAIAKGDVPQEHWFRLGRKMTPLKGGRALIAWTATMFEYLMPLLVMKRFNDTLLEQTYQAVVQRQIEYGAEKGVPWGISESGYFARDLQLNYQYGPFGIPGLGLKRGLSDDLVISPYSTMLAALVRPLEALDNLRELVKLGAFSRYGFYESLDYTADRLPAKQKFVILRSHMAHHQGMSLVAMNNLLNNHCMQERFHADPMVKATDLLLQERIPPSVVITKPREEEVSSASFMMSAMDFNPRLYSDVNLSLPRTQLLSNGTYSVMLTSTGSGYSRSGSLAINRWREDATRDNWGQYYYIRNRSSQKYWSVTHQPTIQSPESFGATFSEDKVEFWRKDDDDLTRTEIVVAPEDNVELRKISLTNESDRPQEYELTSFMELVLARPNDDNAHPAFSNLFVQTEHLSGMDALLGTRRARSNKESPPWGLHLVATDAQMVGGVQYETDRARFIGRGRNTSDPMVLHENRPLSNTTGSVLDPIFSLRITIRVLPGETAAVTFVTGISRSRQEALGLIEKYRSHHIFRREAELAWTQAQVQLRHLNISNAKAHVYQRLAGRVLYLDSSLRPSAELLSQNKHAQSHLWAYGISGDIPIVLIQISDEKDMPMVKELLRAHEYLRLKGLAIDLVILNEKYHSYLQTLQDEISRLVRMTGAHDLLDRPGGVFLRRTDIMPVDDVILLRTVARVIINAERGNLEEQLKLRKPRPELPAVLKPIMRKSTPLLSAPALQIPQLDFYNGIGGFTPDAKEYVIVLREGQWTPAPWINVIANARDFGCTISECGSGYTFSVNSRENRLTPWSNDPVSDPAGEVIYIRDEDAGNFWTPTALPIRENDTYLIRHGQGYSRFEYHAHGLEQQLEVFVSMVDEVKFYRLKIKNAGADPRNLSVTGFFEWVLGFSRGSSAPYVVPEWDKETGALLARNPYNNEFAARVAFVDVSEADRSFTCDRREFLGRNGSHANPAALARSGLSGTAGAGLDPCAALQTKFSLAAGEEKIIVFTLGEADSLSSVRQTIHKYRQLELVDEAFKEAIGFWDKTLNAIRVKTPDPALDVLTNRWLLYQNLSCRVWARSAFYQSGGAFGFRDQLQDTMALVYSHPQITRNQILTAAARQFKEGDVQHWWHPPTGRGVRTHFSDDLIWLPYVVSFYIKITGDSSILTETVPFIEAPLLMIGQEDSYTHPMVSEEVGTIFEHCARALDRSLKVGVHGLPLMGAGDWNDGMNRVGHAGQGESVWVAWFLYTTMEQFIPLCRLEEDHRRAETYQQHLIHLKEAIDMYAWDGDWYRRAFFDDGTPLGSSLNEECKIDSISQSWAVLSRAGNAEKAKRAMAAVDEFLIRRGDGLIQLFTPPFDKTPLDPGYIKGYVPGVRENGGQYTHAAIWTLMAYAQLGDGDRAHELFAMLNPINHAASRSGLHKYKVEPYVMAADIYGMFPHVGRGGWTWYTGSASWMYRAAIEFLLGLEVKENEFRITPRVPENWQEYEINYERNNTQYRMSLVRDATAFHQAGQWISLVDDGKHHHLRIGF